jgi:hypothetical protein
MTDADEGGKTGGESADDLRDGNDPGAGGEAADGDRNGNGNENEDGEDDGRRTYDAVVDRFEGGLAVLVVEKERTTELVLDREALPPAGREQDAVLRVTYDSGEVVGVALDERETAARGESAAERFDRLARRPRGSEDATDGAPGGNDGDSDVDGDRDAGADQ